MASTQAQTMKALVQKVRFDPPVLEDVEIPQATPGSCIIKILCANVISYTKDIYNGKRAYPYPVPLILGSSAIGRIHALGPDSTALKQNDLALAFLSALHEGYTPGSQKLMRGEWRNGTYAEYAKIPLENAHVLDEDRLLGELGYKIVDLMAINKCMVGAGGLIDINLRPGETVIVAPATGGFGGAAVHVALAMGAKVIAMGRNTKVLASLEKLSPLVKTVQMTGNYESELASLKSHGEIDAFFDISPPEAYQSTHFKAAIMALRHGGRVSLMGGQREDVLIPHVKIMHWNITLKGKWMYERGDIKSAIKLVENGQLKIGEEVDAFKCRGAFTLDRWEEAFETAAEVAGNGHVVLTPGA